MPKIAEADGFVRAGGLGRLREIHPEVCFWALAGGKPMEYRKLTGPGRLERLQVLRRYEPKIDALVSEILSRTSRKEAQEDDILDAAAAFVTAEAAHGELSSLAGSPPRDLAGLPMEMVYLKT